MRKYEVVLLLNQNFSSDRREKVFLSIDDIFKKSSVQNLSRTDIGRKRLAYPIKNSKEAFFVSYYFEADPQSIQTLRKLFSVHEYILNCMVVKVDEKDNQTSNQGGVFSKKSVQIQDNKSEKSVQIKDDKSEKSVQIKDDKSEKSNDKQEKGDSEDGLCTE